MTPGLRLGAKLKAMSLDEIPLRACCQVPALFRRVGVGLAVGVVSLGWRVQCPWCGWAGRAAESAEEAARAWNRGDVVSRGVAVGVRADGACP